MIENSLALHQVLCYSVWKNIGDFEFCELLQLFSFFCFEFVDAKATRMVVAAIQRNNVDFGGL